MRSRSPKNSTPGTPNPEISVRILFRGQVQNSVVSELPNWRKSTSKWAAKSTVLSMSRGIRF